MTNSRWARLATLTAAAMLVVTGSAVSVSAQSPSAPAASRQLGMRQQRGR